MILLVSTIWFLLALFNAAFGHPLESFILIVGGVFMATQAKIGPK